MEIVKQFCCPAVLLLFGFSLLILWWAFYTAVDVEEPPNGLQQHD